MPSQFPIRDAAADRAGTSLVRLCLLKASDPRHGGQTAPRYLRMTSLDTGRAVGGLLEAIGWGATTELLVDPLLRQDLGVGEGTAIEVEPMIPGVAAEVCLQLVAGSVSEDEAAHACRAQLKHQPLASGQTKFLGGPNGTQIVLRVLEVRPQELAVYGETSRTRVLVAATADGVSPRRFSDLRQFHGAAVLPLERVVHAWRNAETCRRLGVPLPQCVLISGARGSGRLSLAHALAAEMLRPTVVIDAHALLAVGPWQLAGAIGARFRAARDSGAVLIIKDLEMMARGPREAVPNHDRTALAVLAVELERRDVLVVCTSSAGAEELFDALRFDIEVAIPALDRRARQALLEQFVAPLPLGRVDLGALALRSSGWHLRDLARWCHEAARLAIARSDDRLRELTLSQEDFDAAQAIVCPQGLRGDLIDRASASWEQLGGIDRAKTQLREAIRMLIDPEPFADFGIRAPRGILLHGAPGCGKTALARVLAATSGLPFLAASASSLLSKWFGDSEARVRELFRKARQMAPCIVFLDELESVGERRGQAGNEAADRLLAELLVQMDGLVAREGVLVLAATNRKDLIDEVLLRPGRFDELIEIPLPDAADRAAILAVHLHGRTLVNALDLDALAERCAGLSGAELAEAVRRARLAARRLQGARGNAERPGSRRGDRRREESAGGLPPDWIRHNSSGRTPWTLTRSCWRHGTPNACAGPISSARSAASKTRCVTPMKRFASGPSLRAPTTCAASCAACWTVRIRPGSSKRRTTFGRCSVSTHVMPTAGGCWRTPPRCAPPGAAALFAASCWQARTARCRNPPGSTRSRQPPCWILPRSISAWRDTVKQWAMRRAPGASPVVATGRWQRGWLALPTACWGESLRQGSALTFSAAARRLGYRRRTGALPRSTATWNRCAQTEAPPIAARRSRGRSTGPFDRSTNRPGRRRTELHCTSFLTTDRRFK